MEKKEVNKEIENMNRTIENYKESLKNLFFSISEDEEDKALENIYKKLVEMVIDGNMLKNKIDKYLMDKKFDEDSIEERE